MSGPVFLYKSRYILGFGLVEMAISTNPKPTYIGTCKNNTAFGGLLYLYLFLSYKSGLLEAIYICMESPASLLTSSYFNTCIDSSRITYTSKCKQFEWIDSPYGQL